MEHTPAPTTPEDADGAVLTPPGSTNGTRPDHPPGDPPSDGFRELWDEKRLADYLGVGQRFIRRICEECGRIRYLLVARHRRFDPADIAVYLEAEKRGAMAATVTEAAAAPAPVRRRGRPIGSGRTTPAVTIAGKR